MLRLGYPYNAVRVALDTTWHFPLISRETSVLCWSMPNNNKMPSDHLLCCALSTINAIYTHRFRVLNANYCTGIVFGFALQVQDPEGPPLMLDRYDARWMLDMSEFSKGSSSLSAAATALIAEVLSRFCPVKICALTK